MSDIVKYLNEFDKKLEMFKTAREWSDFMTHLANLIKHISQMPNDVNPLQLPVHILNKRLNQCLSPSLPAGVHNEVIHVYSLLLMKFKKYIEKLQDEVLIDDCVSYMFSHILIGLFTFSRFSKIQSKTPYFNLINNQLVSLNVQLDPFVRNILLGLLPGMEEDNDLLNQVNAIITKLYNKVCKKVFWNHLWNVYLLCPTHRISIINFINKNQNLVHELKYLSPEERSNKTVFYFLSETMLVCSLKAGLRDENTIIIRGTLDILTSLFNISDLSENNKIALLEDLITLFIYKDIALNKRIETFIDKNNENMRKIIEKNENFKIGVSDDNQPKTIYDYLVLALERYISNDSSKLIIFFKIININHDKDELCEYLSRKLFMKSIIAVYNLRHDLVVEVLYKQINIFIDSYDSSYVWFLIFDYLYSLLANRFTFDTEKVGLKTSKDDMDLEMDMKSKYNRKHMNRSVEELTSLVDIFPEDRQNSSSSNGNMIKLVDFDYKRNVKSRNDSKKQCYNSNKHIHPYESGTTGRNTNDILLNIIMFLLSKTTLKSDEMTKRHLLYTTILILNNINHFTYHKLISFLNESSVFIKPEPRSNAKTFESLIGVILDFYNENNELQLNLINNSYISTLGELIKNLFMNTENFYQNNRLLIFFVSKYEFNVLGDEFILEYYKYLCKYIENNYIQTDEILDNSKLIFDLIKDREIYKKLLLVSDKLFSLLLKYNNHKQLSEYNLYFNRRYEFMIVKIFKRKIYLKNIFNLLKYCLKNQNNFHFFNLLIVLNEYSVNISYEEKDIKILEIRNYIHEFYSSIDNFDSLFLFIFTLIFKSSIDHETEFNIENPDTSTIKSIYKLLKSLILNSSLFNMYLKNDNMHLFYILQNYPFTDVKNPGIVLFCLFLKLFALNNQEIQLLSLDMINMFHLYNLVSVDNMSIPYYLEYIKFITTNFDKSNLYKQIPTIYFLCNSKNEEIVTQIFDFFFSLNIKDDIDNEVINLVFSLEQIKRKNILLRKIGKESNHLDYKFRIIKYVSTNVLTFDQSNLIELIIDLMDFMFKKASLIYEGKFNNNYLVYEHVEIERKINEISSYLIINHIQPYKNYVLKQDPYSAFFRILQIKKDLYDKLFLHPNLCNFTFINKFEDLMETRELTEFYTYSFDKAVDFYNSQKNKTVMPEYFIWYLKKIKQFPALITRWCETTYRILESVNLLLLKITNLSLKKYSTKEEQDNILEDIFKGTKHIINKLDTEKYRAIIQSFIVTLFCVLKTYDGKIYDIALSNLYNISLDSKFLKFYKLDYLNFFYDCKFFIDTRNNFESKIGIFKTIVAIDQQIVIDLFDHFEPQKFFKLKDIDLTERSLLLYRLSFIFFCSEKEQLSTYVPICIEKMVDSINSNSVNLKKSVYFLIRQMVFKIDPIKLSILWPTIISDINCFFERIVTNKISTEDLPLLIEIIKTLEIFFIYRNDNFIELKWACIEDYNYLDDNKITENILDLVESVNRMMLNSPLLINEKKSKRYFSRILEFIKKIKNDHCNRISRHRMILPEKREPLMVINNIDSLRELLYTFENLGIYHKNMDLLSNEINESKMLELSIDGFLTCD